MIKIRSGQILCSNEHYYVVLGILLDRNKFNGIYYMPLECINLKDFIVVKHNIKDLLVTNSVINLRYYLSKEIIYRYSFNTYLQGSRFIPFSKLILYDYKEIVMENPLDFVQSTGIDLVSHLAMHYYVLREDINRIIGENNVKNTKWTNSNRTEK